MEEKLNELRNRQRREKFWNVLTLNAFKMEKKSEPLVSVHLPSPVALSSPLIQSDNESVISYTSDESISTPVVSRITYATRILYFLLWITCFLIAIQVEFGAVYLVISGLLFIYFNTGTKAKKPGEISAYSVFNPNCESINGTLKAEQFEKEFNIIHYSPPTIK